MAHPTSEQLDLIRNHVLLNVLLEVVMKNMEDLKKSNELLKNLFISMVQIVINEISNDIRTVRADLKTQNIKVWEVKKEASGINYAYSINGYEGNLSLMRQVVKNEIGFLLTRYTGSIEKKLRDSIKPRK